MHTIHKTFSGIYCHMYSGNIVKFMWLQFYIIPPSVSGLAAEFLLSFYYPSLCFKIGC